MSYHESEPAAGALPRLLAPFTQEQVVRLNEYQRAGWFHPFTCPNREDHPFFDGDKGVLVATFRGWICCFCDYTQGWAHQFMAEPRG